jgi:23S rRNA (pseudouridine1915-N3)-methyltransferase
VRIVVRAVGKMRDRRLSSVCDEYLERVGHHLGAVVEEVERDADLTLRLPTGAEVVALEEDGERWDSPAFAKFIERRMVQGCRALVFLIGGADGLAPATVAKAKLRLSLSPMTLPHRLARVVLCEQLYRAISIVRGEPYDRR